VSATLQIAPVRKSIVVAATPLRAFEVFTSALDHWWPRTHSIGNAPIRRCVMEPFVGGRWYNDLQNGSDVTVGHVRVWEPGQRFVLGWEINAQWKPDSRTELASEVEVRFVREDAHRTRIEVEHRHFERMGGEAGATMRNAVENGWPGVLELFNQALTRLGDS
jgi:hypothetical protein